MENFRSPGTKVPQERKFPKTFVPGNFRSRELLFPENEGSWEISFLGPFVPGNFRSHYPIGLVAALRCVLNYCMFGYDFTLMTLTPLWTSQLTLYVGRPAFAAPVCLWCAYNCVTAHKTLEVGLMSNECEFVNWHHHIYSLCILI